MSVDENELTDKGKLLFAAGFVFGVMVTMIILAVVLVIVRSRGMSTVSTGTGFLVTAGAGTVFAAIVGTSLYYLAFPENRTEVPLDPEQLGSDDTRTNGDTDAQ